MLAQQRINLHMAAHISWVQTATLVWSELVGLIRTDGVCGSRRFVKFAALNAIAALQQGMQKMEKQGSKITCFAQLRVKNTPIFQDRVKTCAKMRWCSIEKSVGFEARLKRPLSSDAPSRETANLTSSIY